MLCVCLCAGTAAYSYGSSGSNSCASGYIKITSESACRAAADAKGEGFNEVRSSSSDPKGCYRCSGCGTKIYYNTHWSGSGNYGKFPLCVAGSDAPTTMTTTKSMTTTTTTVRSGSSGSSTYALGSSGSNSCPSGSTRITTESACGAAASANGVLYSQSVTNSYYPRGCFKHNSKYYFNGHSRGDTQSGMAPVCTQGSAATAAPGTRGSAGASSAAAKAFADAGCESRRVLPLHCFVCLVLHLPRCYAPRQPPFTNNDVALPACVHVIKPCANACTC